MLERQMHECTNSTQLLNIILVRVSEHASKEQTVANGPT